MDVTFAIKLTFLKGLLRRFEKYVYSLSFRESDEKIDTLMKQSGA